MAGTNRHSSSSRSSLVAAGCSRGIYFVIHDSAFRATAFRVRWMSPAGSPLLLFGVCSVLSIVAAHPSQQFEKWSCSMVASNNRRWIHRETCRTVLASHSPHSSCPLTLLSAASNALLCDGYVCFVLSRRNGSAGRLDANYNRCRFDARERIGEARGTRSPEGMKE